jgi:hypothetical protein
MMRLPAVLLHTFIAFFIFGCAKNKTEITVKDLILGTWELQQQQGGMMPSVNYPTGNGNLLKFTASGYQRFANGQLVQRGMYKLERDASVETEVCLVVPDGEFQNRIVYSNDPSRKVFVQVSNNKLQLLSGCFAYDAGTAETYVQLQNDDPTARQ